MYQGYKIVAIIPALDEALSIEQVVSDFLALQIDQQRVIDQLIVCDNGSKDLTASLAESAGADVVYENQRGYGAACLAGINAIKGQPDWVLFIDGDGSVVTKQSFSLFNALVSGADIVIGSRVQGNIEPEAMTYPQYFGNQLITWIIRKIWSANITDLGPFRAIQYHSLQQLNMTDKSYGWTVEMQIKAIQHGLKMVEVPVDTKKRMGFSKISGTVRGVIGAAVGIFGKIYDLWRHPPVKTGKRKV